MLRVLGSWFFSMCVVVTEVLVLHWEQVDKRQSGWVHKGKTGGYWRRVQALPLPYNLELCSCLSKGFEPWQTDRTHQATSALNSQPLLCILALITLFLKFEVNNLQRTSGFFSIDSCICCCQISALDERKLFCKSSTTQSRWAFVVVSCLNNLFL